MIIGGAVAVALLSVANSTAAAAASPAPPWVVLPTDTGCRVDLELTGSSGGVTPVSLISDGQLVSLRFFKADLPARAFLPIRIDKQRYSNLMLRGTDGSGELVLTEETEAAMKRGGTLGVAWLSEEPLSAPQLAQIKAQTAAADAQRRQVEAAAERQRQEDAAVQERAYADARQQAYEDDRRRAYEEAQRRRAYYGYYDDEDDARWAPPPLPPRGGWPRPRYPYVRY